MAFQAGSPEHLAAFQKRARTGQLTQEEREKLVSIHEAAHAVCLIDFGFPVDRATIIPEPGANGSVDAPFPVTFENFQKLCIATLAAGILESSISGTSNIAGDIAELCRLSRHFSINQDQFLDIFGLSYNEAAEWVVKNLNQVLVVAKLLSEKRTLTGDEVASAIQAGTPSSLNS